MKYNFTTVDLNFIRQHAHPGQGCCNIAGRTQLDPSLVKDDPRAHIYVTLLGIRVIFLEPLVVGESTRLTFANPITDVVKGSRGD